MLDVTSHLIDPRIGVLVREGKQLFYACIDGEFPERSTAEAVLELLQGGPVAAPITAHAPDNTPSYRDYEVSYRGKTIVKVADFDVYLVGVRRVDTEWPVEFTRVLAPTPSAAKRAMKDWIRRECIFDRHDGRIEYTAKLASD